MPERESALPPHDPDARLGDLFENLPAPAHRPPTVDNSAPVPGSRRAAREAASAASAPRGESAPAASAPDRSEGDASEPARSSNDAPDADVAAAPIASIDAATSGVDPSSASAPASAPSDDAPPTRAVPVVGGESRGGSLEDLFDHHADDDSGHHGPKTTKKRRGCLVALIVVLALIGGLAAAGAWVMNTYGDKVNEIMGWGPPDDWEPGQASGEVMVTINEGDTGGPVSEALFAAGVTRTKDVFYDYLVDEDPSAVFYPGVYKLQKKMTAEAALAALRDEKNKLENTVNVPEGRTLKTIVPGIAESLGISEDEVAAAVADPAAYGVNAQTLEGWLFPAVYTFDPGVTPTQIVQRMVDRTRESLAAAGVPDADAQRILTIASIIQREGRLDDFPKVSRVIQNRLQAGNQETHGLLQMDSNAQYGYGLTHEGPVSEWDWNAVVSDPNPWNTYVHAGLPAGPIASVTEAAIEAAMNPADGPWYYFVTVNLDTGETVFSATYAEQQQAEAQYRKWCEENPDGGCY